MKSERGNASDERAKADYSDLYSEHGFNLLIDTGKGFLGNVKASENSVLLSSFNDNNRYFLQRYLNAIRSIEFDNTDTQYQNAEQMAVDLISELGINVVLGDAYLSKDSAESNRQFYVFCFDTIVCDSVIDNTSSVCIPPALIDVSGKDGYEDVPVPQYDKVIPYERLKVWVEGDKIVQFESRYPVEVTEIVNDNVAIAIDYSEAIEIAKQFAYVAFIDPRGNTVESKLDIYKIELVLVRIKEKDIGNDIVVPVWNFCGAWLRKVNPANEITLSFADENGWMASEGAEGINDVLITINALDGTIVDMAHRH